MNLTTAARAGFFVAKNAVTISKGIKLVKKTTYFKNAYVLAIVIVTRPYKIQSLIAEAREKMFSYRGKLELLKEARNKLHLFFRMLNAYFRGYYSDIPWTSLVKAVAAIVYFVMIFDAIPDFIPVLGFTDDVAVILWVAGAISKDLDRFRLWEKDQVSTVVN